MITIEYSVCSNCCMAIAYGDDDLDSPFNKGLSKQLEGNNGHFENGVQPTEDDPEGIGFEEFSWASCEICESTLGGSRHGATLIIK